VQSLPTSIKEEETYWPKDPSVSFTREKEELVRIWRVTSSPLLQTKTFKLRATGFFKSFLRVKAELFKMIQMCEVYIIECVSPISKLH